MSHPTEKLWIHRRIAQNIIFVEIGWCLTIEFTLKNGKPMGNGNHWQEILMGAQATWDQSL